MIDLIPQLYDESSDTYPIKSLIEIRNYILTSDGVIRSKLKRVYGSDLTTTPWSKIPEPNPNNGGDAILSPFITVSSDAITEVWTLTFTSSTEFTISGSISGSQGTGSTTSDSSSSNGYITIPSSKWSGTPSVGDVFYIRVYNVEQTLVELSAKRAAATILNSIYTEFVPNQSETARRLLEEVDEVLNKLVDPNSPDELSIGRLAPDLDPLQLLPGYWVSDEGEDISKYAPDEYDVTS